MSSSMIDRPGKHRPVASVSWYTAMGLVGFGFGLLSDRRPFGDELFVHPLVLFVILTGLSLLALRVLLARPVPEVISDRTLLAGCAVGILLFLVGNFIDFHFPLWR